LTSLYLSINKDVSEVYRFLDKFDEQLKYQVEQVAFKHINKVL